VASLITGPLAAQSRRAGSVLVLEAANEGWKEGVQALVAELLTSGYDLSVRAAASAHSPDQLQRALQLAVAQSGAAAGVSLTREADRATAWLCRRASTSRSTSRMASCLEVAWRWPWWSAFGPSIFPRLSRHHRLRVPRRRQPSGPSPLRP
jgi:hypothetical protein